MLGAGVSLRLKSVQVKNLVEGGSQSDASGFDKVDGDASQKNTSNEETEEVVESNPADF